MRQTSWEGLFQPGEEKPTPLTTRLLRLSPISWEEIVTLAIVLVAFATVVESVDSAGWVREMPSLYTVAFIALGLGLVLAKSPLNELSAHLTALIVGIVAVFLSATSSIDGSLGFRVDELYDRMGLWLEAVFTGGISNDNLPFVLLVVLLTYVTAYFAGWSVFRWYNAWLGLIPGGIALLTNASYLPGEGSLSLAIYLFAAILLVARLNVLRGEREWRRERTGYPDLISLHVLNITVWVAFLLVGLAWILPISGGGVFVSAWRSVTAPIAEPLSDLGRVFTAIDTKRGGSVHNFGSTLPLQGAISLTVSRIMEVTATEPGFLRAQSYDFYTAQGWKLGPEVAITSDRWPALRALQSPEEARRQLRRPVSVTVTTLGRTNVIVSVSQPLAVSVDARIVFGPAPSDVTSIRPTARLNEGEQYRVDSTVSNASVGSLRAAPEAYPAWTETYLQLPLGLPAEIGIQALQVTRGANNPFDGAVQIEQFLRTFAIDTQIDPAPAKRDSVAYFLFDVGRGYFDYHASAMVVMLRSMGVPARLAAGYVIRPEDRIPNTNTYVISGSNSFAWPEVYFPDLGWIEFNPTPSEPTVTRTGTDEELLSDEEFDEFLPEDLEFLIDSPPSVEPASEAVDELKLDEGSNLIGNIILAVILGFLMVTVAGGAIFQLSWQRGLSAMPYPVQLWEKTLRLARWARIRPAPTDTARDVTARLQRELPEVEDLEYLGESFLRSRYGRKELDAEETERLTAVWRSVRNAFWGRIFRWK